MKLFYTPPGDNQKEIKLHELGTVTLVSQLSSFTPQDLPQKEVRTLTWHIDFFASDFGHNYDLVTKAREALLVQNGKMKWTDEDEIDENDVKISDGEIYMNHTVRIASQDVPEDPNSWGTYRQKITIQVEFEKNDIATADSHLKATFLNIVTNDPGLLPVTLGFITIWKPKYSSTRYSELRNIRERAAGGIQISGRFVTSHLDDLTKRRASLAKQMRAFEAQVKGKEGQLKFGEGESAMFDGVVRVDAFEFDINQAVWSIDWTMTVSWTAFPNETAYAAADYKVSVDEDEETGDSLMTLGGVVAAATDVIALAKLQTVINAALNAESFTVASKIRNRVEKGRIDADDGATFLSLSFDIVYRRRKTNVTSYQLQISTDDSLATGMVRRSYTGTIVCSGSTDTAAFNRATALAQDLGDNKHDFRISGRLVRNDRKVNDGPAENVRVEFGYDYITHGDRLYMEINSDLSADTFGENTERVSGFVIAPTFGAAEEAYQENVKALYANLIVRNENTGRASWKSETGTYQTGGAWKGTGKVVEMAVRYEFSLLVYRPKAVGSYAIKYGMDVDVDYVNLRTQTSLQGSFVGGAAVMEAARTGAAGNKLDAFIAALIPTGVKIRSNRGLKGEKVGDGMATTQSLSFTDTIVSKATPSAQILSVECAEEINYTGTRWVIQPVPDGICEPQDCGITSGTRTVSGSVMAATETAGRQWIKKIHALPFPTGIGGGVAPSARLEDGPTIKTQFNFLELTDGTARGNTANFTVTKLDFSFKETLINYPYVEP